MGYDNCISSHKFIYINLFKSVKALFDENEIGFVSKNVEKNLE